MLTPKSLVIRLWLPGGKFTPRGMQSHTPENFFSNLKLVMAFSSTCMISLVTSERVHYGKTASLSSYWFHLNQFKLDTKRIRSEKSWSFSSSTQRKSNPNTSQIPHRSNVISDPSTLHRSPRPDSMVSDFDLKSENNHDIREIKEKIYVISVAWKEV